MKFEKIAFVAARQQQAQDALVALQKRYGHVGIDEADVIVALGGDGFALNSMHKAMKRGKPVYGLNRGSVGFIMNEYNEDGLLERLEKAEPNEIHPLVMEAENVYGDESEALALNEVSLLRENRLASKIRIYVDGVVRLDEMICDGVLLSTPAGSTAYNFSAHGPIIPLGADILALTPISVYRPRRWRGALLPHSVEVMFEIINPDVRRVSATADFSEVREVARVTVREDRSKSAILLFDPEHNLEERIIKEQFIE